MQFVVTLVTIDPRTTRVLCLASCLQKCTNPSLEITPDLTQSLRSASQNSTRAISSESSWVGSVEVKLWNTLSVSRCLAIIREVSLGE